MNVLALEPWYAGSHRQWLDGLTRRSRHSWESITLPGQNWRWRMEMGALTLAEQSQERALAGYEPDVIVASSMLNLPVYLSLLRREWSDVPAVVYFHENQLTYPLPESRTRARAYWQINALSAMAADAVVFNSAFHRDNFLNALSGEIDKFGDYLPRQLPGAIREKSEVIHVGLDVHDGPSQNFPVTLSSGLPEAPVILRNQRWDYDKNPEAFLEMLKRLDRRKAPFQLILTGKGVDRYIRAHEEWRAFDDRILFRGFVDDRSEYLALLEKADMVVSTAIHEFFGVAVVEAISKGCHPLLPDRLSYPEIIPESLHRPLLHAPVLYRELEELVTILISLLEGKEKPLPGTTLQEIAARFSWSHLIERYDELLESVARTAKA